MPARRRGFTRPPRWPTLLGRVAHWLRPDVRLPDVLHRLSLCRPDIRLPIVDRIWPTTGLRAIGVGRAHLPRLAQRFPKSPNRAVLRWDLPRLAQWRARRRMGSCACVVSRWYLPWPPHRRARHWVSAREAVFILL